MSLRHDRNKKCSFKKCLFFFFLLETKLVKRVREELVMVVFVSLALQRHWPQHSLPRRPLTPEQRGVSIPAVTSSRVSEFLICVAHTGSGTGCQFRMTFQTGRALHDEHSYKEMKTSPSGAPMGTPSMGKLGKTLFLSPLFNLPVP